MLYHQSNVLVDDDGVPRLSDFGSSHLIGHRGFTTTIMGTLRYMAPELLREANEAGDDADNDGDFGQTYSRSTKETDVFGFSMLAIDVSDSHFEIRLSLWIFCRCICTTPP